jgi:hypothetical protein
VPSRRMTTKFFVLVSGELAIRIEQQWPNDGENL